MGNTQVTVIDPKTKKTISYSMDDRLKKNLDEKVIPSLQKKDKDYIIALDGGEGVGKSWLAIQIGKYVDPSLNINRICFTPEEFREAVYKANKGQCIIYDEAFTGFSSRASLSGVNRTLVSLMMQMRQKNLFVIIVLPTIFLLDKYVSLFRTKALIHVFESKGLRGYFRVYSRKLKTMLVMSKEARTFSYRVKTKFKGRFYGVFALGEDEEQKYREKKAKALEEAEKNPMSSAQVRYREQRDIMIYVLRKQMKLSYRNISELLSDYGFEVSYVQIRSICAKFGDKEEETNGKKPQTAGNPTDNPEI